jgi:hypothetical protein
MSISTDLSANPFVTSDGRMQIERVTKALELMRCDSVLQELRDCRSNNKRLIAWFEGRRSVLAAELEVTL